MKYTILALIFCLILPGCPSISRSYENALKIIQKNGQINEEDFQSCLGKLDNAILYAREDIQYTDSSNHDQYAYILPMAEIAKARLYNRVDQIENMEKSCWKAIKIAESLLGKHIRKSNTAQNMFQEYSVYFRREKIRRHAFTILQEAYRRVGEKDLSQLMQLQIVFSDSYLISDFAHQEEEYIREAENAVWVKKYNQKKEDIRHTFTLVLLALGRAAEQMAIESEKQQIHQQLQNTYDPYQRAILYQRLACLNQKEKESEQRYKENVENENIQHHYNLQNIQKVYQQTSLNALVNNFRNLQLSPQIKNLPSFNRLISQTASLDNYIQRKGFDEKAADDLMNLRNTLDELTKEAQNKIRISMK